jgi:hypothetical protein
MTSRGRKGREVRVARLTRLFSVDMTMQRDVGSLTPPWQRGKLFDAK